MILLAIDTSTRMMGLAVYNGVEVLCESAWMSRDNHTIELAPAVASALRKSGIRIEDLGALGVALGPGSFTALRVGLALAKGLAMVRHLPLVGIPTLDILAAAQPVLETALAAVLRAGRGRLAVGWYRASDGTWQAGQQIEVLTAVELNERICERTLVCGELTGEERRFLARNKKYVVLASPAQCMRRPSFLAELAWQRWQSGKADDPATLSPFYLHYKEPIPG